VRFELTWSEGSVIQRRILEAESSDDAVRRVAGQLGHPPGQTYEVEPLDDLGYDRRRELVGAG
jgi:hypothetical protein